MGRVVHRAAEVEAGKVETLPLLRAWLPYQSSDHRLVHPRRSAERDRPHRVLHLAHEEGRPKKDAEEFKVQRVGGDE